MESEQATDEIGPDISARLIAEGWPSPLAKATWDPFVYAVGLTTGGTIVFGSAADQGHGWVLLHDIEPTDDPPLNGFSVTRGVVVRLSAIAWAMDKP